MFYWLASRDAAIVAGQAAPAIPVAAIPAKPPPATQRVPNAPALPMAPPPVAGAASLSEDIPGKLNQLAQLRDSGVLTVDEFQRKKEELLERL